MAWLVFPTSLPLLQNGGAVHDTFASRCSLPAGIVSSGEVDWFDLNLE